MHDLLIRAGALGFSTSRTMIHCSIDGEPVPGTYALENELMAFATAVKESGGLMEMVLSGVAGEVPDTLLGETRMMERIARQPERWLWCSRLCGSGS